MSPKEKAKELIKKFSPYVETKDFFGDAVEDRYSKKCALISVDEILNQYERGKFDYKILNEEELIYWKAVRAEIATLYVN